MKLSAFLAVVAVVAVAFGLAFVVAPEPLLATYGISLPPAGLFVGRLFGAALIALGLVAAFSRNVTDGLARNAILRGYFVGELIGFVCVLWGQIQGVTNMLGWSTVAIYFLFTLGFGYFLFMKPAA